MLLAIANTGGEGVNQISGGVGGVGVRSISGSCDGGKLLGARCKKPQNYEALDI